MQHASTCSCSRRNFLRGCGLTLTGFGVASMFPTPLIQQALAGTLTGDKRLLFVFLRGGNDGINAVIPHGDAAYNAVNRPSLYIAPGQAIDLNGFASLHPALTRHDPISYDAGDLAVLHRSGLLQQLAAPISTASASGRTAIRPRARCSRAGSTATSATT